MLEIVIIHRRVREERHVFLILRLRRPLDPQSSIACLYILRAAVRRLASEGCLSSPAPGRMKGSEVPPVAAQSSALCRLQCRNPNNTHPRPRASGLVAGEPCWFWSLHCNPPTFSAGLAGLSETVDGVGIVGWCGWPCCDCDQVRQWALALGSIPVH